MDIAAGTDLAGLKPGIEQVERSLIIWILRRHERRQQRHKDHHDHHDQGSHGDRALPIVRPEIGEPGPAGLARQGKCG